jgi:SNF2 family DNA or RNA helicase
MAGYGLVPSNYDTLKKLRESKTATLKPCKYLKPTTKLRYYQVIGAANLLLLNRMILADSAGLGKTVQLIAAYCFLLEKDPTLKLLIICPKSAVDQWAEEFEKFTTGISVHIMSNEYGKIKGSDKYDHVDVLKKKGIPFEKSKWFEARKIQYTTINANVLITNWHAVQDDYPFLASNRTDNFILALDEVQEIKNRKTDTHFGADYIAQKAVRVYGLSATIIKNKLEEAYNIFRVVVPGLFGSRAKFNKNYLKLKKQRIKRGKRLFFFNKIIGYKNLKEFRQTIDPYFLIRKTKDVASELPTIIAKKIMVEMTDAQRKLYVYALSGDLYRDRVKDRYFQYKTLFDAQLTHSEKEYAMLEKFCKNYQDSLTVEGAQKNKIARLAFCQLVANGPQWLNAKEVGDSSKEEEFRRIFDQELRAEKTIVFTRFKSGIPRLESILNDLEIKSTKITGDVTGKDRKTARLQFQEKEDTPVIFITFAGSAALNLQAANIILFYDTPWSYGDLYQTIGRAQRIGSIYQHIHVIHMVSQNSIDEHVIEVLEGKKDLISNVMGDIAEGAIEFKPDETLFKEEEESTINALFNSVFKKIV